jgi:hypothetical protein
MLNALAFNARSTCPGLKNLGDVDAKYDAAQIQKNGFWHRGV